MAETGDFFVVRSVDGGNLNAGDGASSSGVSLRDVAAADEAIAAGMPVGGKAWIARVVENGDGDRLGADETAEIAPPPARAPGGIALFAFTREVGSIDAGVVQLGDGRGATAGIGVNLRFFRGDFEIANNTKAQHAVLFIG